MSGAGAADRAPADRAAARARRRARQLRWIVPLGALAVRALGRTWRVTVEGRESADALRQAGASNVYAVWHGELLAILYTRRGDGVVVLISEHHDGEIMARVAERLGFGTVRGSTSRGAARALLALVRELEAGRQLGVTPDGPRGPAHAFAPGALVAAQRAGAPIVPIAVRASRAWRLRSWDRFLIPKPFARVSIVYGEPLRVEGATAREAAAEVPRFERALAAAGAAAERLLGAG